MVFSSVVFLFYFLPIFLLLYFLTPFKNTVLLVASLLFYAWGELGYTIVLLLSITINYLIGLFIHGIKRSPYKRMMLILGISLNLLLLGYFKYFNFLFNELLSTEIHQQIHLPLGISFFTFQAISYLFDVYKNEAKVEKNLFNVGLYIAMFPQLIAGPIVRFKTVAEQIHQRNHNLQKITTGVKIFIIGLAQKILIANTVAEPADAIFGLDEDSLTAVVAWLGAVCYCFQIYFDFAGYSNMAIGLGLILGFKFPSNFNYPYISRSITEFWQRWHISLSTWFRDYLYIPLGGNRKGMIVTYRNLMIVFILCGLWHGAAWTFVLWGLFNGTFLILERLFLSAVLQQLYMPLRHLYVLLVVLFGWVIFRAENFNHLQYYLQAMLGQGNASTVVYVAQYFLGHSLIFTLCCATLFSTPVFGSLKKIKHNAAKYNRKVTFWFLKCSMEIFTIGVFVLSLISVASGSYNPFIYFRF